MTQSPRVDLATQMPLLAKQAGIWVGTYRYYDAEGHKIDEHASRLTCRVLNEGPWQYHQTNEYSWADGRTEVREFRGNFVDGKLRFDSDLIEGWAAEEPLDEHRRTLLLYWVRRGEPDTYLYEMIQVDDDCKLRTRVWQWISAGACRMRTLIDERKLTDDRR